MPDCWPWERHLFPDAIDPADQSRPRQPPSTPEPVGVTD